MQNNRSKQRNNKSGYIGVYFYKATKKWRAAITIKGKKEYLGQFETPEDASNAYLKKAQENQLNVGFEELSKEEKQKINTNNKK